MANFNPVVVLRSIEASLNQIDNQITLIRKKLALLNPDAATTKGKKPIKLWEQASGFRKRAKPAPGTGPTKNAPGTRSSNSQRS
jgi:hypothetical protein